MSRFSIGGGRTRFGLVVALIVVLLDQSSKWLATDFLAHGRVFVILPGYFDFVLVHNVGAAFGLLREITPFIRSLVLGGVAVGAVVFILVYLAKSIHFWLAVGFGCILGGAVGNMIDRVRLGWVVDFIHLHWHDLSWPVFNLADSAISVGVLLLLLDNVKNAGKAEI